MKMKQGEQFVCFGEDRIHVLVKEGTRKTDEGDWKISFHFVFQVSLILKVLYKEGEFLCGEMSRSS